MSEVGVQDTVLDVTCGPGLATMAFAAKAKQVTGIDLTPAMIERARQIQQEKSLINLSWQIGTLSRCHIFSGRYSLLLSSFSVAPGGVR
jgi:2-polyprenyl-3-methyl-5-hydroxy-6-metoxy-1,4-benzoquinol methylase